MLVPKALNNPQLGGLSHTGGKAIIEHNLEVEIFGKKKELAIEVIFNVIQFVRSLSFRNSIPELRENEIVGIGYFLGSEFLGLGVGDSNFGKVFYSEVDFEDFTEIFSSFGSLLQALNKNI